MAEQQVKDLDRVTGALRRITENVRTQERISAQPSESTGGRVGVLNEVQSGLGERTGSSDDMPFRGG